MTTTNKNQTGFKFEIGGIYNLVAPMGVRTKDGQTLISRKGDELTPDMRFEYTGRIEGRPALKVLDGPRTDEIVLSHRNHFDAADPYNSVNEGGSDEGVRLQRRVDVLQGEMDNCLARLEVIEAASAAA